MSKISRISNKTIPHGEEISYLDVREGIMELIKQNYPDFKETDFISLAELNYYRRLYLTKLVEQEKGELAVIDKDVMQAIRDNAILSENIHDDKETKLTFGQKVADHIAVFGGSWTFIIIFFFIFIPVDYHQYLVLNQGPFRPLPFYFA